MSTVKKNERLFRPHKNSIFVKLCPFLAQRVKISMQKDPEVAMGSDNIQGSIDQVKSKRWTLGILNDPLVQKVPGSVLLHQQEQTALPNQSDQVSSSINSSSNQGSEALQREKKRTPDGKIILDPQPEDSKNDPLNLPLWRKNAALSSLGIYCVLGGGMTPILAAGFKDVASTYNVTISKVALTTGLYMMGLGVGSVIASPISLLFGKRFVYLCSVIAFIATSCWCAAAPSYNSLLIARTFQGVSVSPVECLPSATITEIFFLHERAFKVGIYALLLVGGKNLVPLVGAMIVQYLGWRWIFWIVAISVTLSGILLFIFVPESHWDRKTVGNRDLASSPDSSINEKHTNVAEIPTQSSNQFVQESLGKNIRIDPDLEAQIKSSHLEIGENTADTRLPASQTAIPTQNIINRVTICSAPPLGQVFQRVPSHKLGAGNSSKTMSRDKTTNNSSRSMAQCVTNQGERSLDFRSQLKPYHGRMSHENWFKVAIRPFKLFAYPAVLWSAAVYSCSVGWLIVLSESVIILFRSNATYGFSALSIGLIYISPLIGGVLGTAVAGKISDFIAKYMSRKNGGLYEPEFRLLMAVPVAITTVAGLIGIGWSVQEHNYWIVPVTFFGIISFGCSLGVTTAITFCVDSYKQYAVEALVTLNFSKNIFHGLAFSFFVTKWIEDDGPKKVFMWLGLIQLMLMFFTIPMYIFGKKARIMTHRL
ncbi:hypothetical protein K3495_g6509 [Podosphaera aphanis]|nr:hypothetical protein K3495_g6509 [Podosphaera aphanis]